MNKKLTSLPFYVRGLLPKIFLIMMLFGLTKMYAQPTCTAITGNFSENFDTTSTGSSTNPSVPNCWSYIDNMSTTGYGYTASSTTTVMSPPNFFQVLQNVLYSKCK